MEDRFFLAAACAVVPGLGRKRIRALVENLGSAEKLFRISRDELIALGCPYERAINFIHNRRGDLPEKLKYFCECNGVRILSFFDVEYPYLLRQISDPPLALYVKGAIPEGDCAAIVGSRRCTDYGIRGAEFFAAAFARNGVAVISGGAKGIDTAAHAACLRNGGRTVAVLGCGIDVVYPPENEEIFECIARFGAVVTEYFPGTKPLANNFPARNRIIVGLAKGVLVAEATRKSGAIITANIAADESRDVFCIPGNIFNGASIGCHDLIRNGAKPVDGPDDILGEITTGRIRNAAAALQLDIPGLDNIKIAGGAGPDVKKYSGEAVSDDKDGEPGSISETGSILLNCLRRGALSLEELVTHSGRDFTEVSVELLQLQIAGLVRENLSRQYQRI